jgi:hypothetical protein
MPVPHITYVMDLHGHQNMHVLRTITNEILCNLSSDLPHIMCLTEHHLSELEIQFVYIDNYTLSTYIYLEDTNRLKQLNALLKTNLINLTNTVTFPTRIGKSTSTAIDIIFIDVSKYKNYFISSLHNRLSDHGAQLLTIALPLNCDKECQTFS